MSGMSNCHIHPLMFSKQTKVTTGASLFFASPVTGAISPLLFANSINTITDAGAMFCHTRMTSVGSTFLNGGGKNTKLKRVYAIFYGCGNLEGTSPEFWNGAKFTAMGGGDSNGYAGALCGCTKLTNYAIAESIDPMWTAGQGI